jgi:hypothetical protein
MLQVGIRGSDWRRRRRKVFGVLRVGQQAHGIRTGRWRGQRQCQWTSFGQATVKRFLFRRRTPLGRSGWWIFLVSVRVVRRKAAGRRHWRRVHLHGLNWCGSIRTVAVFAALGADLGHRTRFDRVPWARKSSAARSVAAGMLTDWSDVSVFVAPLTPSGLVEGLLVGQRIYCADVFRRAIPVHLQGKFSKI